MNILEIDQLVITHNGTDLVHDLSLAIAPGRRMGLIGESGSGKSLTAMAIMGLLPAGMRAGGSIQLGGQQIIGAPERQLNQVRGNAAAVVFQEPLTALDPLMKLGQQMAAPLARTYRRQGRDSAHLQADIIELFERVSLPEPQRIANAYPFEVSGGQRQRVAIAMALACQPKLLIADEPTTALDVTTQAEILALLDQLVRDFDMALLFISHDLPVVASIVDQVCVLRHGQVVETGPVDKILRTPSQAYTRTLVEAARAFDQVLGAR